MKNLFLKILFLLPISIINGQTLPYDYNLSKRQINKILDSTPASNTIERILIQDDVIWLATSKGLSKSIDNGSSWTNYYKTEAFEEESISAIDYHNGNIWASTWHYEIQLGDPVPVGSGLRYSNDNGETWIKINQPVDDPGDSLITYGINTLRALPVTVEEQNFIYDIEFTNNTIWIATFAGGLRKSTNNGEDWERVVLPPDNLNSIKPDDTLNFSLQPVAGAFGPEEHLNHRAFSIVAVDDNTLYVGTAGGINKSTDGGISWVKFNHTNQLNPISGNFVLAMDYNQFDGSIWAATWKAEGATEYWAASASYDGGENWNTYLTDERILDFGFKYYGNAGNFTGADLFIASQSGVYRSNNYGVTWIAAPDIYDSHTNIALNTKHFRAVEINRNNNSFDIWLGSINGLALFKEASGFWDGEWKVYLASEGITSSSETYAFPNPFSPDDEVLNIKYSLKSESKVTIRIMDFGMNLVRTLIQNANRPSSDNNIEVWNGKDEYGNIVPNGIYFYRIDTDDGEPSFGKILVIM